MEPLLSSKELSEYSIVENENSYEYQQFMVPKPLSTLIQQSIGPLFFSIAATVHDATNLYYIKKGYGQRGSSIVGITSLIRIAMFNIAGFFARALLIKANSFLAEKKNEVANLILTDTIKLTFFVNTIFTIIIYFILKPTLLFIGTKDDYLLDSINYIYYLFPILPFLSLFQIFISALSSEGRSFLCGFFHFLGILISLGLIDPLLIFIFKIPISFSGISYLSGYISLSIILTILYFSGIFTLKPKFSMFLKNSGHISEIISLSYSYIIDIITSIIPPFILLYYANKANTIPSSHLNTVFGAVAKPIHLASAISVGFMLGLTPSASYSYSIKNLDRTKKLFYWSLPIPMILKTILVPLMILKTQSVMKIWISDPDILKLSQKIAPDLFLVSYLYPFSEACTSILLATQRSILATIPILISGIGMAGGSCLLYYIEPKSSLRVFWAYTYDGLLFFIVSLLCCIPVYKEFYR